MIILGSLESAWWTSYWSQWPCNCHHHKRCLE